MTEQQTKQAADDCGSQTEAQKGKGGALITCFLTFGDKFSTDNRAVLRAVFKCMNGKPASAPGGKEWEKQKGKDRALLTGKSLLKLFTFLHSFSGMKMMSYF